MENRIKLEDRLISLLEENTPNEIIIRSHIPYVCFSSLGVDRSVVKKESFGDGCITGYNTEFENISQEKMDKIRESILSILKND